MYVVKGYRQSRLVIQNRLVNGIPFVDALSIWNNPAIFLHMKSVHETLMEDK